MKCLDPLIEGICHAVRIAATAICIGHIGHRGSGGGFAFLFFRQVLHQRVVEKLRVGREILQHCEPVAERENRHALPGFVLVAHELQHLPASVGRVSKRGINGIQQENGQRTFRCYVLRPVGINARTQAASRTFVLRTGRIEYSNLLRFALLLKSEIGRLKIRYCFAVFVGRHNVNQHQVSIDTDGRRAGA